MRERTKLSTCGKGRVSCQLVRKKPWQGVVRKRYYRYVMIYERYCEKRQVRRSKNGEKNEKEKKKDAFSGWRLKYFAGALRRC